MSGGLHKEDTPHASGDIGTLVLGVRVDAAATMVSAEGDYSPLQVDANGALLVSSGAGGISSAITSVVPGTGATNLGKAEDAAHATGHVGVMVLSVRANTAAATSDTDGDYQPLITDTNGRLHTLDGTSLADDAAFTPATSRVMPAGFIADETASDSVDEGDVGAARMTLDRKIHVVNEFESNSLRASGVALVPKFAAIAGATSGNNELVANVASRKIRVLAMFLVAGAAGNIYFTSDAAGTVIFGGSTNKIQLAANGGFTLPFNPLGWFETAVNQDLVLNASSTGPWSGGLVYCEVA